jgi:glucoamylase
MMGFANDGMMIPEQVWDRREVPSNVDHEFIPELKFGEGTGSATPLAWSMAQFIRLAMSLKAGHNLETPQIVSDRYRNGVPSH